MRLPIEQQQIRHHLAGSVTPGLHSLLGLVGDEGQGRQLRLHVHTRQGC